MAATAAAFTVSLLLAALSSLAAARPGIPFHPCNTLFITYTTISTTAAAVAVSDDGSSLIPRRTTGVVSIYRIVTPFRHFASPHDPAADAGHRRPLLTTIHRPENAVLPLREEVPAFGFSSLKDRAKDILVVVVGLLFGVGCGALTATTMYLVWSLITNRFNVSGVYEDEEEEDDVQSLKKAGYIKIPATEPAAVAVAAPAKEGYQGN